MAPSYFQARKSDLTVIKMEKITKNKWERPPCNLCGSSINKVLYKDVTTWEYPDLFRIVKCQNCGLEYLSPRPKNRYIGKYYDTESYWGKSLDKQVLQFNWKIVRDKELSIVYANIFSKYAKGRILDVGCGTGEFLTKFKEEGWDVLGTELSKEACLYAKKVYGLHIMQGDLLDLHLKSNQFDVVTLNSTLEHLYEPFETIKKVSKLLKKGGLVVITVPNIDSLGVKIFKEKWLPLHPPKHLYHFNSNTLSKMLNKSGFKIEKVDHWYWSHSYYSIFETIRYTFSPKFKRASGSGIMSFSADQVEPNKFSIKNQLSKYAASIFAIILSIIGSSIRKGEVITVYASKEK